MSSPQSDSPSIDPDLLGHLKNLGLLDGSTTPDYVPLTGGVSSEIAKVTAGARVFCVKRALSKLKVEADWFAPVERNLYEVAWYQLANRAVPGSAPRVLGHDKTNMLFAMEFLDPKNFKLWKDELMAGRSDVRQAKLAGERLGKIHAHAAHSEAIKAEFPRTDIFKAIRLEPYLEATAAKHPELKTQLMELSQRTGDTRVTVVHGDISPKNILLGAEGPVFLDAECACISDPAFDLAFCLNHFLLKCLHAPDATDGFMTSFANMSESYLDEVNWEDRAHLEARAASLLPGLFLARVDGKSPVEYIVEEADKMKVRRCAQALLLNQPTKLAEVAASWKKELSN